MRRRDSQIVEMDLEGNGKKEKFEIKTHTTWRKDKNGAAYSTITLSKALSSGELEKIWDYRFKEIIWIDAVVSPLDPQKPGQSFLILNCAFGGGAGQPHVFKWDGNTFREVESGSLWGFGSVTKMRDGKNAILIPTGSYGDEGPDIYTYKKGYLLPSNYDYPEYYQQEIAKTLKDFDRFENSDPGVAITIATRGLMRFLYGGRTREGARLYNRIWKLHNQIVKDHKYDDGLVHLTALFRSYAFLEMGQKTAGLKKLWEMNPTKYWSCAYIGDYYYFKNDFKTALKYYQMADDEQNRDLNKGRKPKQSSLWDGKIKLLKMLLKEKAAKGD